MRRSVERTHDWGDTAFAWGTRALAVHLSRDGKTAWSVHEDGALVAWDVASGALRSVVSRGTEARSAVFLPDAAGVIILRAQTIERRDIVDGALRWTAPCYTYGTLLAGSSDETVAIVPGMFVTNYAFSTATGKISARSGNAEVWLALAGTRRVAIAKIPDPNPPPVTAWDAAGDPIYEPDHPTFELHIVDAAGRVVMSRDAEGLSQYAVTATFSRDGAMAFVADGARLVAYDASNGTECWSMEGPLRVLRTQRFGESERLLVVAQVPSAYELRALRMNDGTIAWKRPGGGGDALSDDGSIALSGSQPIVAYDVARGTKLHASNPSIRSVAVSSSGDSIVRCDAWSGLAVLDVATGTESERITIPRAWSAIFAPDDEVWTGQSPVVSWRVGEAPVERRDLSVRDYQPFRFSPSGRVIALHSGSGMMVCKRSGEIIAQTVYSAGIDDVRFESDDFVVIAHGSGITRLAIENPLRWIWTRHIPDAGPSSNSLVAAIGPGVALVAERDVGRPPMIRHEIGPRAEGRLRVVVFDANRCEERFELRRWTLADPHGRAMLAVTVDGARGAEAMEGLSLVRVWDLANGQLVSELDLGAENDLPTCLAFAPAGDALVIGTAAGRTLRYAIRSGEGSGSGGE